MEVSGFLEGSWLEEFVCLAHGVEVFDSAWSVCISCDFQGNLHARVSSFQMWLRRLMNTYG